MKPLRLIPANTAIDFIKGRGVALIFSSILILGSIGLLATKGLNFGIDFTGGTMIEIQVSETPDLPSLREKLEDLNLGAIALQEFGGPQELLIRLPQQEGAEEAQGAALGTVKAALEEAFGADGVEYRRTEYVGPQVGEELKKAGTLAVLFSLAGILIYIWVRFEWPFGVAAVAALAHDTIATLGLFALTQMDFSLSTLAAILMIGGYSINDTVVVFDRVRENKRKHGKKSLADICNLSVNETLSRTIMTSVTTLLALGALWLFGGEVIQGFVNALLFGILIGTYSSIYVAAPVLMLINKRKKETGPVAVETA